MRSKFLSAIWDVLAAVQDGYEDTDLCQVEDSDDDSYRYRDELMDWSPEGSNQD